MWLRFLADFDFHPPERRQSIVAYKKGMVKFVRRICAEQAIAKGKAVVAVRPK